MHDEIYLIPAATGTDSTGSLYDGPDENAARLVFGQATSVTRAEHYKARAIGLRLSLVVTINRADYEGERYVRYHDTIYDVERDFLVPCQKIEITCKALEGRTKQ